MRFLSEEEHGLNGLIELLDEKHFFSFLYFFRSSATSGMIPFSTFMGFASLWYGLSSNDWDDVGGVYGKLNVEARGFCSSSMAAYCSFTVLQLHSAAGRTNRKDVNGRLVNAFINGDDCDQQSLSRSDTSYSALL